MVEMSGVEKFMVEMSGVENFLLALGLNFSRLKLGVEKSGVEMSFNHFIPQWLVVSDMNTNCNIYLLSFCGKMP